MLVKGALGVGDPSLILPEETDMKFTFYASVYVWLQWLKG